MVGSSDGSGTPGVELGDARDALVAASRRTAELLSGIRDGRADVARSDWTIGEVAAHLVVVLRGFACAARGELDAVTAHVPPVAGFRERLTAVTAATLELVPEREPARLARSLGDGVADFLAATASMKGDDSLPVPWYGDDAQLPLSVATCLLLGEQLVHGYDLAKTVGRPWPISDREALLLIPVLRAMMPVAVRPEAARRMRAAYEVRVRGAAPFSIRVGDGSVTVEPPGAPGPDCVVRAGALPFALLAYGRVSQWRLAATAQIVASGRKPWLALRLKGLFFDP